MLAPGSWLGLLGGGQLGRMFAMAAETLGYRVLVLDPDAVAPASAVCDEQLIADYDDEAAVHALARRVSAVTTEFENVPARSLALLAETLTVAPQAASVAIAQDRMAEKRFLRDQGIPVAPFHVIENPADLDQIDERLFPGVLKAARLGYDGKGQVRVSNLAETREAHASLGHVPAVLEKFLALDVEVSVVVVRDFAGTMASYPVVENIHREGILAVTRTASPRVSAATAARARAFAEQIAQALDYRGVLCVEFFVLKDGQILANEMAPRPHNSGHYTIDACYSSQFDAQARVLARAPLGDTTPHSAAVMLNLLGDIWLDQNERVVEPDWQRVLRHPRAKLHLYGKREARRGRKMGHLTLLGDDPATLWHDAQDMAAVLGIAPF